MRLDKISPVQTDFAAPLQSAASALVTQDVLHSDWLIAQQSPAQASLGLTAAYGMLSAFACLMVPCMQICWIASTSWSCL